MTEEKDTYRSGDPDFEVIREAFYDMVRRNLRDGDNPPSTPPRKQKVKKASSPMILTGDRDGRPFEVERYGDPAKAMYRDNASSAIGWLIYKGHLNSLIDGVRTDQKIDIAYFEGTGRRLTADALEKLFEKAQVTPLKSPDLEGVGGGSFGPRNVPPGAIISMMKVRDFRKEMPEWWMALLERILIRNEHVWHGLTKKRQQETFQEIRVALDFAGWVLMKLEAGRYGAAAVEKARLELCRKWPAAEEWFRRRGLHSNAKDRSSQPVE